MTEAPEPPTGTEAPESPTGTEAVEPPTVTEALEPPTVTEAVAPRAGILITGTEVLSGIIADRNGPWLSERLREIGVDAASIQIVGDRPDDLLAALRFMAAQGLALVITSGGLGPTADDLTAEVVARFTGREIVLDPELEAKIEQ